MFTAEDVNNFYIGGHFRAAGDPSHRYSVISPATGMPVADVADPTMAEVEVTVAAARGAFDEGPWPTMPIAERAEYVRRLCDLFEAHLDEWNAAWRAESGPSITHTELLHGFVLALWRDLLARAPEVVLEDRRSLPGGDVDVLREPMGVALIISTWNGPALYIALKLVPALLAGCTVIWKMAQESHLTARVLAKIIDEAGFPEGVISVLAAAPDVSAALVDHPGVDKVSLTGGVVAGRSIMAAAAQRIASVTLELGGKSPAIVAGDIPLERILPTLVPGFIAFQGQICVALTRLVVPRARHDEIVDGVVDVLASLKIGDPEDPATVLGPLGTPRQLARTQEYVDSAHAQGAKLVLGGRRPAGLDQGFYYEPTVFTEVRPDMRIAQEEIFGPVLSVLSYDDFEDAIRIANGTDYGLAASVYTDDLELAERTARRLQSGTVSLNDAGPSLFAPFGGYKMSGIGREGGATGMDEYLQYKSVRRSPAE
jgi:aldehyde dehydrogenase (NAD+)